MKKDNLKLIVFTGIIMFFIIGTVSAEICECNSCKSCTEKLNDNSCDEVKLVNDIIISDMGDYIKGRYGPYACIVGCNVKELEMDYVFNNKIFDCQGHEIKEVRGDDQFEGTGIGFLNVSGNTIKNCIISGFSQSIVMSGTSNKILNNSISFSSGYGIFLGDSEENEVIENSIYGCSEGIHVRESSKNTIINNKIYLNSNGITLYYHANFNKIENNNISNNSENGIYMTDIIDPQGCKRAPAGECSKPNTGNEITKNEITKNKMGILSLNSNFTLNSNIICGNKVVDISKSKNSVGEGNDNACDNPNGWNDKGKKGCTYKCNEQKPPDKPTESDYNLILSIAVILITIILSLIVVWYRKFR